MAGENRAAADAVALSQALAREPHQFDFFQVLRRLECSYRDRPRLGRSRRPADDPIRLAQPASMAFAPSTLAACESGKEGRPPRLEVNFFGLLGPNGPLPLHLTEYARDRLRNAHDPTFVRFLDLFHHRLLSLFYRAWAEAQPTVQFDRPDEDRFSVYVGSLFGLGMASLRHRDAMPDLAKLHYAGRLACQTRHAEGLEAILADFFKLPVTIEQFVPHWMELPVDCRWQLGTLPETGRLGVNTVVGERVWDCQHKFRIRFGPLSLEDYQRLLPGGLSLERLAALVRNCLGDEMSWDLHLILQQADVPPLKLGGEIGRLGWTTWLLGQPLARDADDLYLHPDWRPHHNQ
jgi:type VI secretion system protein ImpH